MHVELKIIGLHDRVAELVYLGPLPWTLAFNRASMLITSPVGSDTSDFAPLIHSAAPKGE
jgi:hypothetical protein